MCVLSASMVALQGNIQRLAQQGLLESLSQFQLQQLLAQQQNQAQRTYQENQGLWQGRSNSPGVNNNNGNGLLDPSLGRRLYQR